MRSTRYGLTILVLLAVVSFRAAAQQPPPGAVPLTGLTPAERQAFDEGNRTFNRSYTMADGLGPVFNDDSCADCHRNGGATNRTVRRFGRQIRGSFDAMVESGGSLVQARGIGTVTTADGTHNYVGERVPAEATVSTLRRSGAIRGLGLVDAVPDETWLALADEERAIDPATAGRVNLALDASGTRTVVGKFGWKAQSPSLRHFAADALLNEMGITSPGFRDEICPQGDCLALGFNPAPALNDDGHDVDALTNFMMLLAPPARGTITDAAIAGEGVFFEIGCATCHRPALGTGVSAVSALSRVTFYPYSDFLLHDMGGLGDGIVQGQSTGAEMRTAPLWGLRSATRFLHDNGSRTIEDAIRRHDGQARGARERFEALDAERFGWLLEFLRSL
jgi:CxxC motif-containing protein (DUF1111 family)